MDRKALKAKTPETAAKINSLTPWPCSLGMKRLSMVFVSYLKSMEGEVIRSLGPEGTSLQEKNIKRLTPGMVAFNMDIGQQQLL